METKILRTVIEFESVAVPVEGSDKLVIAHYRAVGSDDKANFQIMSKEVYENSTLATLPCYTFKPAHLANETYEACFHIITKVARDSILEGNNRWYDVNVDLEGIEFGQPLPDDYVVIGMCSADHTYYDLDEKLVNVPISDSYLASHYDIYKIIEDIEKLPDISVVNTAYRSYGTIEKPTSRDISYVPGNGDTVYLRIKLSDENYNEYRNNPYHNRPKFIDENSSLGAYKKPERNEEDWDGYDD